MTQEEFDLIHMENNISPPEVAIVDYRKMGNTTRQVDAYIQQLFNEGRCLVVDHASGKFNTSEHLLEVLIRRLKIEHSRYVEFKRIESAAYLVTLKDKI